MAKKEFSGGNFRDSWLTIKGIERSTDQALGFLLVRSCQQYEMFFEK